MNRLKRKPSGGVYSYDSFMEDDDSRNTFEYYLVDTYTSVEKQVILNELFREFYDKCLTYDTLHDELRKTELYMLLNGYEVEEIVDAVMRRFSGCVDDDMHERALNHDIKRFRRIFRDVFGF